MRSVRSFDHIMRGRSSWRARADGAVERLGALSALSGSERRVLELIVELRTTREIAAILGLSPRTVQNHCAHMCTKLSLRGPKALLRFALEHRAEL